MKKINDVKIITNKKVFSPTGTSNFLLETVCDKIKPNSSILDLGCGTGLIGISLGKLGLGKNKIYLSDASKEAVKLAKTNAAKNNISVDARVGSLFEPWKGMKFDNIIDDVSGVAEDIAKVSPWFKNVPCESGYDGTNLVIKVLKQAPRYLNKNGKIFFPILSLSNNKKIIKEAKKIFKKIKLLDRKTWPLPAQMQSNILLLKKLSADGIIDIDEKFGTILWYTDIYSGEV